MIPNPQLAAIALLVKKFGKRIEGGGYEVEVSHLEMKDMSPHGQFQEVPALDMATVKWQYFPRNTIEGESVTPVSVTPISEAKTLSCGCDVGNCICDIET